MQRYIGVALALLAAGCTSAAPRPQPIIDNERVTVWDTTKPRSPAQHDFVSVSLTHQGTAAFGHPGDIPGDSKGRTIVIQLKDHPVPPLPNTTGYVDAFDRPRVVKLLENDKVIVWSYRWNRGEPTPMHFHSKDAVVVYEDETTLQSTTPDRQNAVNEYKFGETRFNRRDRTHTELLVKDSASAVITELK